MKRSTIMALMEGHKLRLNESLIFFKATNDLDRAGDELTTYEYDTQYHEFGSEIHFDIEAGTRLTPTTKFFHGNDVVVGFQVQTKTKRFIDEVTDGQVQNVVRQLIADEVSKFAGQHVGTWQVDCKLTMLYLDEKLTWEEYVGTVVASC